MWQWGGVVRRWFPTWMPGYLVIYSALYWL